jgi:hypothetical protein
MVKVCFIIQMAQNMMVIVMKMFVKVTVHTHIQIMILMKVNGKIIKDMAKEHILMQRQVCVVLIEFVFPSLEKLS